MTQLKSARTGNGAVGSAIKPVLAASLAQQR